LKKTEKSLCDLDALRKLIGVKISSSGGNRVVVDFICPVALWVDEQNVWELYPFYKGASLYSILEKNSIKIQEECLGELHNALFNSVSELQALGVLHRDVNPSNILLLQDETKFQYDSESNKYFGVIKLGLTDFSFCSLENSIQVSIGNERYSPREQLLGKAVKSSDFYSVAATLFYLAKGRYPSAEDKVNLQTGHESLDTGSLGGFSASKLWGDFLNDNASQRPPIEDYTLRPLTAPGPGNFLGVLDLDELGLLVLCDYGFEIIPKNVAQKYLYSKYNYQLDMQP
ncbi:MAG: hypothetical protein F6K47_33870, partial [Symploca sp. SIO2E6]|nr:hypothetical protein [Symploca sp. SIO2E6]